MLPAFALLITAAGVALLLEQEPPRIAFWLACVGIGIYMLGTRSFMRGTKRVPGLVRAIVLVATFQLGRLEPVLSPYAYVWLLTAWVVTCAVLTTQWGERTGEEEVEGYLGRRHSGVDAEAETPR